MAVISVLMWSCKDEVTLVSFSLASRTDMLCSRDSWCAKAGENSKSNGNKLWGRSIIVTRKYFACFCCLAWLNLLFWQLKGTLLKSKVRVSFLYLLTYCIFVLCFHWSSRRFICLGIFLKCSFPYHIFLSIIVYIR